MQSERARKELLRLGFRIAELREKRGATQEALAETVELSVRQLQRIEAGEGNPDMRLLVALADALRCQTSQLFKKAVRVRKRRPGRPRRA